MSESDRAAAAEHLREAKRAIRQGGSSDVLAALRSSIELDPEAAEAQLLLGRALLQDSDVLVGTRTRDQGLVAEAIDVLSRAAMVAPGDGDVAYWLGQALSLGERKEEAVLQLRRSLELEPEHGVASSTLGILLGEVGRVDESVEQLKHAVGLRPNHANTWAHYGFQLELAEDLVGARAAYERSVELEWSVPGTYSRLATVLRRAGDADGAKEAVRAYRAWKEYGVKAIERLRAAKADRSNPDTLAQLAEVQLDAGLSANAIPWLTRALNLDPEHQRSLELMQIARRPAAPLPAGARFRLPTSYLDSSE